MSEEGWAADITDVPTDEDWLYLAGVLDLGSRRVVGWAMGESLETSLPMEALQMALRQRRPKKGLLHHSDRGCQYASEAYREHLAARGVMSSMSRRGNGYDNAAMESFWSPLKEELVQRTHFASRAEAAGANFDYIETFYNRERLHRALGYLSPVEFEKQINLNYPSNCQAPRCLQNRGHLKVVYDHAVASPQMVNYIRPTAELSNKWSPQTCRDLFSGT